MSEGKRAKQLVAFRAGRESPAGQFPGFSHAEDPVAVIAGLSGSDRLVKLSDAQDHDPALAALLKRILDEADDLSLGTLSRELVWASMTILLSAPGIVTPYHIDHQSNLLFQLRGWKTVSLFDPHDRRVLGEAEIEQYYQGTAYAAEYRAQNETAATVHQLTPGMGLHNPPLGPHWVRNGDDVSLSISINFGLRQAEAAARVYQVNHGLRQLGLRPRPPGRSDLADGIKLAASRLIAPRRPRSLERLVKSGPRRLIRPLQSLARRLSGSRRPAPLPAGPRRSPPDNLGRLP